MKRPRRTWLVIAVVAAGVLAAAAVFEWSRGGDLTVQLVDLGPDDLDDVRVLEFEETTSTVVREWPLGRLTAKSQVEVRPSGGDVTPGVQFTVGGATRRYRVRPSPGGSPRFVRIELSSRGVERVQTKRTFASEFEGVGWVEFPPPR